MSAFCLPRLLRSSCARSAPADRAAPALAPAARTASATRRRATRSRRRACRRALSSARASPAARGVRPADRGGSRRRAAASAVGRGARIVVGGLLHALGQPLALEIARRLAGGRLRVLVRALGAPAPGTPARPWDPSAGRCTGGLLLQAILQLPRALGEPLLFAGQTPHGVLPGRRPAAPSPARTRSALRVGELPRLELHFAQRAPALVGTATTAAGAASSRSFSSARLPRALAWPGSCRRRSLAALRISSDTSRIRLPSPLCPRCPLCPSCPALAGLSRLSCPCCLPAGLACSCPFWPVLPSSAPSCAVLRPVLAHLLRASSSACCRSSDCSRVSFSSSRFSSSSAHLRALLRELLLALEQLVLPPRELLDLVERALRARRSLLASLDLRLVVGLLLPLQLLVEQRRHVVVAVVARRCRCRPAAATPRAASRRPAPSAAG